MDVHAARQDGRTLRRIIALLVSLAALAERVAGRSLPVRFLVLWFLRRAEIVATGYVLEAHGVPPSAFAEIAMVGNDPADALMLAARFRALAAALAILLPLACGLDRRQARRGSVSGYVLSGLDSRRGGWRMVPNDTS